MKIQAITLAATAATAAATLKPHQQLPTEIAATSDLGRSLLSQSRRLDGEDEEEAFTWISGYSLKFQGCRHHATYNADAEDNENGDDVRVQTSKLAHFRLCPANSCETWLGGGCTSNYGDYVVDLATFAKTYVEGQKRAAEYKCQMYMYESCDCNDNDDKDDGFNQDYCEFDCFSNSKKMQGCVERNPYNDDENSEDYREFEAQEYVECREYEVPEDDDANNGRRLDGEDGEEVEYYIGPYCSANGGSVHLGLYTDDTCTVFADSNHGKTTYKTLSGGEDLPFGTSSLITSACVTCLDQQNPNSSSSGDGDDAYEQGPEVSDQCAELYESAGKCEGNINADKAGMTSEANNAACSYINGIQFTKVNGVVEMKSSKAVTAVIIGFAGVFIGLAGVVYKLTKQVQEARSTPLLD